MRKSKSDQALRFFHSLESDVFYFLNYGYLLFPFWASQRRYMFFRAHVHAGVPGGSCRNNSKLHLDRARKVHLFVNPVKGKAFKKFPVRDSASIF